MRRVTFSRNFTLSLSRTCQCYCKYCAFATHRAHLYAPDEVERLLDDAVAARREGAAGAHGGEARGEPRRWPPGSPSTGTRTSCPTSSGRASGRSSAGCCPHTNVGVCTPRGAARLRQVTASQGLMLESVNPDLVVHQGSPTKHPERRLETIRLAGELRIPFTSGILVGIGEAPEERVQALEALAEVHARARPPPGGDPPELRAAPALLRRRAGRDRRRGAAHRHARRGAAAAGLGERR